MVEVWKSVRYGVSKELDTAYWRFLGVETTLDIFQNIIFVPYIEYGALSISGYGVLSFILYGLCQQHHIGVVFDQSILPSSVVLLSACFIDIFWPYDGSIDELEVFGLRLDVDLGTISRWQVGRVSGRLACGAWRTEGVGVDMRSALVSGCGGQWGVRGLGSDDRVAWSGGGGERFSGRLKLALNGDRVDWMRCKKVVGGRWDGGIWAGGPRGGFALIVVECKCREGLFAERPQRLGIAGTARNWAVILVGGCSSGGCLTDESLVISLEQIQLDDKLHYIEELVEIMDHDVKQSRIPIVKVRWNSRRGPEFTWSRLIIGVIYLVDFLFDLLLTSMGSVARAQCHYMALPPRDQRHPFLRFEGLEYTDADIVDFEERLGKIYGKKSCLEIRGPLVLELILEFFSKIRFCEVVLGLDTVGALQVQLGRAKRQGSSMRGIFFVLPPSYTANRDPMLRLCHRLIMCNIAGRSQASKKGLSVIVQDLPVIDMAKLVQL
ncbi:hypothetical protein Tco_0337065 [Tanacetum coccineum]